MPQHPSFSGIIVSVERAIHALRHGLPVCIESGRSRITVLSAEASGRKPESGKKKHAASPLMDAALQLAKHAALLPQLTVVPASKEAVRVSADAIHAYKEELARRLSPVSEARVPILESADARVIAFRPPNSFVEHLAVLIGKPEKEKAPLVRVHSSCITGDLLGSLRCDCGAQLHGALKAMDKAGSGILLYLNQEGRGIGIANKLRAYALQDKGLDTVEANRALGFDADERTFLVAALMLKKLKVKAVRLLTNNPAKVASLAEYGIRVIERVPLAIPPTRHNARYLDTKAKKCGHLL